MDEQDRKEPLLSRYLMDSLLSLQDDLSESEKADNKEWETILKDIVSHLEGFAEEQAKQFQERIQTADARIWTGMVDDHYSLELVAKIPEVVNRFKRLSPVLVDKVPGGEVTVYLREASRCFIYGFPQSTIALCRAALESGVNHIFQERLGTIPTQDLAERIDRAARFNWIRHDTSYVAREILRTANSVLHDEPASDDNAFTTLALTRKALQEFYT